MKFYHVAISRLYYSIYQKMLYILYAESVYEINEMNKQMEKRHSDIYYDFIRLINKKYFKIMGKFGMEDIEYILDLKSMRKEADYSNDIISEADYNSKFKDFYDVVIKRIDNIIGELGVENNE